MENPATWGDAERVIARVLQEHHENELRPPMERRIGWSLPRLITHALQVDGLLRPQDEVDDEEKLVGLLWEAREQVDMWSDVVEGRVGKRDPYVDSVRDRLDEYRKGLDPRASE